MAAAALLAATLSCPPVLHAQQDGLVAFPDVYHLQFENAWVRVTRVRVPAGAWLADHTHPAGLTLYVYLTDADSLTFIHRNSAAGTITRPVVAARSYRIARTGDETHAVSNVGGRASEYLRVEIRTTGTESMQRRIPAPPVPAQTSSVVEVATAQVRITRISVAPRDAPPVTVEENAAALLVALTGGVSVDGAPALAPGQERFLEGGRRVAVRSQGYAPVQLLRVDFLTRPAATP